MDNLFLDHVTVADIDKGVDAVYHAEVVVGVCCCARLSEAGLRSSGRLSRLFA